MTLVENPTPITISTAIYPDAASIMREHSLDGEYGMSEAGMLEAIHEALEEAQATVNEGISNAIHDTRSLMDIHIVTHGREITVYPEAGYTASQLGNFEKMLKAAANFLTAEAYWLPVVLEALPGIVSRMREEEEAAGEKFRGV